ncbi:MAG: sigma factor-like helix-turn-helix DNA-binding protein [Candidatus Micrarchaeota archaeon]
MASRRPTKERDDVWVQIRPKFTGCAPILEAIAKDNLHNLDPEELLAIKQRLGLITMGKEISDRNNAIIAKGLGLERNNLTHKQIGEQFGISGERVDQIIDETTEKLVNQIKRAEVLPYSAEYARLVQEAKQKEEVYRLEAQSREALVIIKEATSKEYRIVAYYANLEPSLKIKQEVISAAREKLNLLFESLLEVSKEAERKDKLLEIAENKYAPLEHRIKAARIYSKIYLKESYSPQLISKLIIFLRYDMPQIVKEEIAVEFVKKAAEAGELKSATKVANKTKIPIALREIMKETIAKYKEDNS